MHQPPPQLQQGCNGRTTQAAQLHSNQTQTHLGRIGTTSLNPPAKPVNSGSQGGDERHPLPVGGIRTYVRTYVRTKTPASGRSLTRVVDHTQNQNRPEGLEGGRRWATQKDLRSAKDSLAALALTQAATLTQSLTPM